MDSDQHIHSAPAQTRVPGSGLHYAAYRGIETLAAVLPQAVQYAIARAAAGAYFRLDDRARESMLANMRVVAGPDAAEYEVRALAGEAFQSFGRFVCEFIGQRNLSTEFLKEHVKVVGKEHADAAFALGRGVIMCSGHYSNWELGPAMVARLGYPVTAIVQQHAVEKIDALFVARREKAGVRIAHTQHGALRALKALRRNEAVAILGDRPTGGPVMRVRFFGRETAFPQGPWRMAVSSGAAIVPTFVRRCTGDYILEFAPPLLISGYNNGVDEAQALAQAWADCFESRVKADPSQWSVFYPIWAGLGF